MKKLITLFFLFMLSSAVQADSIDVYKVSFRGQPIATYTGPQVIHIILIADSLSSFDTLKVNVQRDTPCANCKDYSLIVFGNKGPMLIDSMQNTASFFIPIKPLVEYRRTTGTKQFNGYYTEYRESGKARVVSFKITLE